jgi:hypothetical protein
LDILASIIGHRSVHPHDTRAPIRLATTDK